MDLVGASLQQAHKPPDVFSVYSLSEHALACWKVGQIDDSIGGEHDGVGVPRDGERLALCVGLYGLDGVFEHQFGEATPYGLELVACGGEQVHSPGRLRGQYEA